MTADLPAIWADVRSQQYSGIKLYSAIGKVLVEKSFSEEVADVVNIFYLSIPILDRELKTVDAEHRRLKLVMDIARSVGYFDIFVSKREEERRLLFEAGLIVLLYFNEDMFCSPYSNIASLLTVYPEFNGVDHGELVKLLTFANFMSCALLLLPAKGKKSHLLDLVTRITEGYKQKYVTGGGQTGATSLRVLIYEREGGVTKMQRPPRRTEWSSILEILKDDRHSLIDIPEQVIQNVGMNPQEVNENPAAVSTQSSASYEHCNQPNVFVYATEVTLASGDHLVRSLSVSHRISDSDGSSTSQEMLRTVVVSCAVDEEQEMDVEQISFDDFFSEEDLRFLECTTTNNSGISFARSSSAENGKVYRNVSISLVGQGAVSSPSMTDYDANVSQSLGLSLPLPLPLSLPLSSVLSFNQLQGIASASDTGYALTTGNGTGVGTGLNMGGSGSGAGMSVDIGKKGEVTEGPITGGPINFDNSDFEQSFSMSSWPSKDIQQLSDLMQFRSFSRSGSNNVATLQPSSGSGDIIIGLGSSNHFHTFSRRSSFNVAEFGIRNKDCLLPVVTDCDDDEEQSMTY